MFPSLFKIIWENSLKDGLSNLGLDLLVKEEDRLPSLNAVKIPEGVDDLSIRSKLLNDYHIEIGGGLGPFAGKVWRIGLMGHSAREENVNILLNALKEILWLLYVIFYYSILFYQNL